MGTLTAGGAELGRAFTGTLTSADTGTNRVFKAADGNQTAINGRRNLTLYGWPRRNLRWCDRHGTRRSR